MFGVLKTLPSSPVQQVTNVSSLLRVFHWEHLSPSFHSLPLPSSLKYCHARAHGITTPHSAALLSQSISSEELTQQRVCHWRHGKSFTVGPSSSSSYQIWIWRLLPDLCSWQYPGIWGLHLCAGKIFSGVETSCLLLYMSVHASLELLLQLTWSGALNLSFSPQFSYFLRMLEAAQDPGGRWHLLLLHSERSSKRPWEKA